MGERTSAGAVYSVGAYPPGVGPDLTAWLIRVEATCRRCRGTTVLDLRPQPNGRWTGRDRIWCGCAGAGDAHVIGVVPFALLVRVPATALEHERDEAIDTSIRHFRDMRLAELGVDLRGGASPAAEAALALECRRAREDLLDAARAYRGREPSCTGEQLLAFLELAVRTDVAAVAVRKDAASAPRQPLP